MVVENQILGMTDVVRLPANCSAADVSYAIYSTYTAGCGTVNYYLSGAHMRSNPADPADRLWAPGTAANAYLKICPGYPRTPDKVVRGWAPINRVEIP
jgi:hypothetical protein